MSSAQPSLSGTLISNPVKIQSEIVLPSKVWKIITKLFIEKVGSLGDLYSVIAWASTCKGSFVLCVKNSPILKTFFICKHLGGFVQQNATRKDSPSLISPQSKYLLAVGPDGKNFYSNPSSFCNNQLLIRTSEGEEFTIDLSKELKSYKDTVKYKICDRAEKAFLYSQAIKACHPVQDGFILVSSGWVMEWKFCDGKPVLVHAFSPFETLTEYTVKAMCESVYLDEKLYISAMARICYFVVDLKGKKTPLQGKTYRDSLLILDHRLCLMTFNKDLKKVMCYEVSISEEEHEPKNQESNANAKETVCVLTRGEKIFEFEGSFFENGQTEIGSNWLLLQDRNNKIRIIDVKKRCLLPFSISRKEKTKGLRPTIFVKDQFLCIFYGGPNFRIIHLPTQKEYTQAFIPLLAPYLQNPQVVITMFNFQLGKELYLEVNFLEKTVVSAYTDNYQSYVLSIHLPNNHPLIAKDFPSAVDPIEEEPVLVLRETKTDFFEIDDSPDDQVVTSERNEVLTPPNTDIPTASSLSLPESESIVVETKRQASQIAKRPKIRRRNISTTSTCKATDNKIYILAASIFAFSIIATALLITFHPGNIVYQNGGFVLTQPAIITLGGGAALSFVFFAIASCHKSRQYFT